jgi:hypothetical protein
VVPLRRSVETVQLIRISRAVCVGFADAVAAVRSPLLAVVADVNDDGVLFASASSRSNHHLHRHAKLHSTTLCVTGPRNQ